MTWELQWDMTALMGKSIESGEDWYILGGTGISWSMWGRLCILGFAAKTIIHRPCFSSKATNGLRWSRSDADVPDDRSWIFMLKHQHHVSHEGVPYPVFARYDSIKCHIGSLPYQVWWFYGPLFIVRLSATTFQLK